MLFDNIVLDLKISTTSLTSTLTHTHTYINIIKFIIAFTKSHKNENPSNDYKNHHPDSHEILIVGISFYILLF